MSGDLFARLWLDAVMAVALDEIGRGGPRRAPGRRAPALPADEADLRAAVQAALDRRRKGGQDRG